MAQHRVRARLGSENSFMYIGEFVVFLRTPLRQNVRGSRLKQPCHTQRTQIQENIIVIN